MGVSEYGFLAPLSLLMMMGIVVYKGFVFVIGMLDYWLCRRM